MVRPYEGVELRDRVADTLLEQISKEMLCLLKGSIVYIRSPAGWKTVCTLLSDPNARLVDDPTTLGANEKEESTDTGTGPFGQSESRQTLCIDE